MKTSLVLEARQTVNGPVYFDRTRLLIVHLRLSANGFHDAPRPSRGLAWQPNRQHTFRLAWDGLWVRTCKQCWGSQTHYLHRPSSFTVVPDRRFGHVPADRSPRPLRNTAKEKVGANPAHASGCPANRSTRRYEKFNGPPISTHTRSYTYTRPNASSCPLNSVPSSSELMHTVPERRVPRISQTAAGRPVSSWIDTRRSLLLVRRWCTVKQHIFIFERRKLFNKEYNMLMNKLNNL